MPLFPHQRPYHLKATLHFFLTVRVCSTEQFPNFEFFQCNNRKNADHTCSARGSKKSHNRKRLLLSPKSHSSLLIFSHARATHASHTGFSCCVCQAHHHHQQLSLSACRLLSQRAALRHTTTSLHCTALHCTALHCTVRVHHCSSHH